VTAVQCAFTIFNHKAQEQDYFWGTLGYVPNYRKEISHGNRMFAESGHVDAIFCQAEDLEAGQVKAKKKKAFKPQDLHEILDVVLESYIKIQDTGFYWDLCYKKKVYENIEFVLFTPNLRIDTDEANKLCGHYSSQTSSVHNLCRYCTVPTLKSDLVTKNWEHKTVRMVKKLVMQRILQDSGQFPNNTLRMHCIVFALDYTMATVSMELPHLRCSTPYCWACSST
jgi:hypothetical protein